MENWLFENALAVRLGAYAGVLGTMAFWEWWAPRRPRLMTRRQRWPWNLGIAALNAGLVRVLALIAPLAAAGFAEARGIGLFHAFAVPGALAILATVVLLDLAIYAQHVAFHHVPVFWRLHRMHHTDPDLDVTTGARFHPIEIALSAIYKSALVLVLGAPMVGIVIFEVLLNATAMFNHSNARLPAGLDRVLRLVIVTPDMHRVHHSIHRDETDSNYGFSLTWWDRLFATYRPAPRDGHTKMVIGLPIFRGAQDQRLDRMLYQPFTNPATDTADGTGNPPATRPQPRSTP